MKTTIYDYDKDGRPWKKSADPNILVSVNTPLSSGDIPGGIAGWLDALERRETQRRWLAQMMKVGVN